MSAMLEEMTEYIKQQKNKPLDGSAGGQARGDSAVPETGGNGPRGPGRVGHAVDLAGRFLRRRSEHVISRRHKRRLW
eukprot:391376-Rhodomonas_salina.1